MNLPASLAIVVELYLAGVWTDISDYVYGDRDIDITRGTGEWSPDVQPGKCTLKLKNKDGRFSPHNPAGAYYGKIGRNIPLRVSMQGKYRFLGEVSEWPLRANPNLYVEIEASGVLRRLTKSASEEQSPFYRGAMRPVDPALIPAGYWPCENVDNNDTIRSAESRKGNPLVVNKSEDGLGTRSGFLGSEPIITLNDSQVYADLPEYGNANDVVLIGALIRLPDEGVIADGTRLMTVNTGGTAAYWRVRANIDGTLNVQIADPLTDGGGGGVIATSANTTWSLAGRAAYVALTLEQSGVDIVWNLLAFPEYAAAALTINGGLSGRNYLRASRAVFGSGLDAGSTAVGHIGVWKYTTALPAHLLNLVNGWRGELAAVRAARVAQEEGIALAVQGSTANSVPMIQQGVKSGLDSMMDAVAADGGVLYEPPDVPAILLANGENGTAGLLTATGPTLTSTTDQAHTGARSVRVTWFTSGNTVQRIEPSLVIGYQYTFTAWVYVPTGMPHVKLAISGGAQSSPSTLNSTWQQLTLSFTATSYSHTVQIIPNTTPTSGQVMYVDDAYLKADRAGLHLVPLRDLYNQTPALTLNYEAAEIALPFDPVDDDRYLVNEAAVSIDGIGDPARFSLDTGPLSTAAPPAGAGRYAVAVTRNVLTGELAASWARWLVHQGTWNEPRFPQITANLNRKRALIDAAALAEPGSVLAGTNTPSWLPPQDIRQLVVGIAERLNVRTWEITYNCTPARPFDVAVANDTSVRAATESVLTSTTTAPAPGTSMTITVTSTTAGGRWNTAGPFPIAIMVAPVKGMIGEEMSVTGISGTSLTQTFTVTRGVNGITVPWAAGSAVFLTKRPTVAL